MPRMGKRHQISRVPAIAVVVSRYNASITDRLLEGAVTEYIRRAGHSTALTIVHAPGAFELPALARAAAFSGKFAAVVCLGCVVKGDTRHDEYLCNAVAAGLIQITVTSGVPCAFGVLTVNTPEQAEERAGGSKGNKGQEAMAAALDTIESLAALGGPVPIIRLGDTKPDKVAGRRKKR